MDWNFIDVDKETKFQLNNIFNDDELLDIDESDIELLENDEEFEELDF